MNNLVNHMIVLSVSSMIQGGVIVAAFWVITVGQYLHSVALLIPFIGASYVTWLTGKELIENVSVRS